MKQFYSILLRAFRNARHYLEVLSLKTRTFVGIAFIAIAVMTATMAVDVLPIFKDIQSDIQTSEEYIPDFIIQDSTLSLNGNKPLYYQSTYFQLVIDDSIKSVGISQNIPLNQDTLNRIDTNTLISLFLFKNHVFAYAGGQTYSLDSLYAHVQNKEDLITMFDNISTYSWAITVAVIMTTFIFSLLIYLIQMLTIALIASVFNLRLAVPIRFKDRLKLTIAISFIPLLFLQMVGVLLPSMSSNYYALLIITMYLMYITFKQHTRYMHDLLKDKK